jgi:TonB family protein
MLTFANPQPQASRSAVLIAIMFFAFVFVPAAKSQTPDDFVHSLVQQKLFLLHVGEQAQTKVKKDKLRGLAGKCDLAVQIEKATWDQGTVRVEFAIIGTLNLAGKMSSQCRTHAATQLEITGFARDERPDSLAASISEVLQTPEQYLAAQGTPFNLPPGSDDEVPTQSGPTVTPIKTLLSVSPEFSEEARRAKYQGDLVLRLVVGTDGRVHKSRVLRCPGMGFEQMALNVLSLWRFTPARQQDKPVAFETNVDVSFNLY